jgi:hypothetical protein
MDKHHYHLAKRMMQAPRNDMRPVICDENLKQEYPDRGDSHNPVAQPRNGNLHDLLVHVDSVLFATSFKKECPDDRREREEARRAIAKPRSRGAPDPQLLNWAAQHHNNAEYHANDLRFIDNPG